MNAIILAGGKSSRFGSDKAMYKLEQKPMLENIVEKLEMFFDKIYIIGNKKREFNGTKKQIEYLTDIVPDKGPLGGLYTGLSKSDSKYNYLQACDMPFICENYLNFMKEYISKNSGYEAYIPVKDGYLEPFVGIYSKNIKRKIFNLIEKGQLNFDYLFNAINVKKIPESEIKKVADTERIFFNINKKEDLVKYKKFKAK
ncbi:MAG: molybdenum cofactor guanylyltransferase [Halanaerobiales bacterium]|nr:molybdenum cofactor guanylyltransferase [Halanaerobiales bacterium]